jgi:integrase/transposase
MAGRRLEGRKWQLPSGKWAVSLPVARGVNKRHQVSFATEQQALAYLKAGIEALEAGRALPDPLVFANQAGVKKPATPRATGFADVAWACWNAEYHDNPARSVESAIRAKAIIELWLIPYFGATLNDMSELRRGQVKKFIQVASGRGDFQTTRSRPSSPVKSYPRATELTVAQVVETTGQSKSSVLRHFKAGVFPNARRVSVGGRQSQIRIPFGDLLDSGVTFRQPENGKYGRIHAGIGSGGASRRYQIQMLSALRLIVLWAQDEELMTEGNDPTAKVPTLKPRRAITKTFKTKPKVFSIAQCATVARYLHIHHQVVMWIQRILGLRVAEVFGLGVGDFYDLGASAIIDVHRQGGKSFWERDDDDVPIQVSEKDTTKSFAGERTLVVPRQLADALRVYIRAFHVDPETGAIDPDARLIVGIKKPNLSGLYNYCAQLKVAYQKAGLGVLDVDFSAGSHHLRKSLATDIRYQTEIAEALRSEILGHQLTAQGGGATVTMQTYTLGMPLLKPLEDAAREIEGLVDLAGCPLLVPSEKKIMYGKSHNLRTAKWCNQVDAVLAEANALAVREHYLTPTDAASLLGVEARTVTKWIRQGKLPATVLEASESHETRYHINPDDVEAMLDEVDGRLTVAAAAAELGVWVHSIYRAAQHGQINVVRDGMRIFLRKSELENAKEALMGPSELRGRSMLLVEAANELRMTYAGAAQLKKRGVLCGDDSAPDGTVYVTRESVAAEVAKRANATAPAGNTAMDAFGLEEAMEFSGLSQNEVVQLTQAGRLKRCGTSKFRVERSSLEDWMKARRENGGAVEKVY